MNVNGITTSDGGSQSGPHSPSSYPNQHHQSIMEYDYLWAPNHYPAAMGSASGCSTGTAPKRQEPSHGFQVNYPVNRTVGSSQQPPVTREQYWGLGTPGQQQGESSVTVQYSQGMYDVYPNQVNTGISQIQQQQAAPNQHQSPTVVHHLQHQQLLSPQHLQPQQQQLYGMMPNGVPCYQSQHGILSSEQSDPLTPLMPTAQMFPSLRRSPQHLHMDDGNTASSMPMQRSIMSPTAQHDDGSPQRKRSPERRTVAHSSGVQGEYYL